VVVSDGVSSGVEGVADEQPAFMKKFLAMQAESQAESDASASLESSDSNGGPAPLTTKESDLFDLRLRLEAMARETHHRQEQLQQQQQHQQQHQQQSSGKSALSSPSKGGKR
jgi:hypothetical protein